MITIPSAEINYLAIGVASVACMMLGFVWYSKAFLGKPWMKLVGLNDDSAKQGAGPAMTLMVFSVLVLNYVLAHFVDYVNAANFMEGVTAGLWIWLGFVVTIGVMEAAFARRPMKLVAITTGYYLVSLAIAGGIQAAWQ